MEHYVKRYQKLPTSKLHRLSHDSSSYISNLYEASVINFGHQRATSFFRREPDPVPPLVNLLHVTPYGPLVPHYIRCDLSRYATSMTVEVHHVRYQRQSAL
ncbi:unnamed protein product [Acanthoscelides obtectus]|uniref:Uncharacterized protein n=1 Tax=Acanthoscelides obtectus TaxID=200917 RepID=A0A9P0LHU1_ACAOB|nr:unnamed protein product [Acanthoscelides obtectus]CAK1676409.1 hypothetical protein AOBTE_LOCUS30739 [Acanthoscelides obtectus]